MNEIEMMRRKKIYVQFKELVESHGLVFDAACVDESDLDSFDTSNILFDVYNSERIYVPFKMDFNEGKWWITADDGYYMIGKKFGFDNKLVFETLIVMLLG